MRIAIFGAGSQGDIQPCVRLGSRLQQAGVPVLLAAPQNFAGLAQGVGLPFHALRGDVQQIMAGETGQKYMESGGANPIRSILAMRKMLGPVALQMAEDALAAGRQADALLTLAVFAPLGKTIAEICNIPLLLIEPTPVLPTGDFPAPGWPVQRNLGRLHNRLSGVAMVQVIWQWYRPFVNEFRQRFGLRPFASGDFHRTLASAPLLGAYSSAVIPRPPDWPASVHITGYWFDDAQSRWQPPAELEAFLSRGQPPVYVGFGSMAGRDPGHFTGIVLQALAQSGQRAVLATGWGGMNALRTPEDVFVLDAAPHGWLFPRMAAAVHHGGAGTTAESLRAGLPTVIVPFIVDQLFWGKRVHALGAGPAPIQAKKLTAGRLADAIRQATSDAAIRQRAAAIGRAIRAEDGLDQAVRVIRQHLGA
jgi:UDP:flavonoid glycosyltransferase YjiC (YdhE family)